MSQSIILLEAFEKAGDSGLTNHFIANKLHILRYSARIADLRKEGYSILAPKQVYKHGKATGTFLYKLEEA